MWDIKLFISIPPVVISIHFHLNHVGYKGLLRLHVSQDPLHFHLNHVGYKVSYGIWCLTIITFPFIWTMWDIKAFSLMPFFLLLPFHLNHVGYKVKIYCIIMLGYVRTFIWTMWDIKKWKPSKRVLKQKAFIWTMWDIKFMGSGSTLIGAQTFIWTMWDIKINNLDHAASLDILSSEPCGI